VIGPTAIGPYQLEGVYQGERKAFITCVEEHYTDQESRANASVKVNVAWDENDYQIDVGKSPGQTEYKRIIDRNAEFGVSHIVYEPANTLHGSRFNTTDGWGWEGSLWFGMGELIREGRFDPVTDEVPTDIMAMVEYAEAKGVRFMAYVYPCLHFQALSKYFVGGGTNVVDISRPEVQDWFISRMIAFQTKTRAGGWAWDHDIYAGPSGLHYGQWRGWMRILAALRENNPAIVMDHRQTAHAWGPWYHISGSYTEPIAGDENPETYGVPIASLHCDHVAADNTRIINYRYAAEQLIPPSRIPGFIFHQTERSADNGTNPCFSSSKLCWDDNIRDFDLLGYKYSLLSTIGTAGQNNVLTMIPARDPEEFALFPAEDTQFIHDWLAWTDANLDAVRNTVPIASLSSPGVGKVDGTSAMTAHDEGFLFLFNPGFQPIAANITVDQDIGLSDAAVGASWDVVELYPTPGAPTVTSWTHGEHTQVLVGGSGARVLQLKKKSQETAAAAGRRLAVKGLPGNVTVSSTTGAVVLSGVTGASGRAFAVSVEAIGGAVRATEGIAWPPAVEINGKRCQEVAVDPVTGDLKIDPVQFGGDEIHHNMPVAPGAVVPLGSWGGGWLNTSFTVAQALKDQMAARTKSYPINWTAADAKASWLVPTRLLMFFFIVRPSDATPITLIIDGAQVELTKAYNSRGLQHSRCFLGFYYDGSALTVGSHTMAVNVPARTDFEGVFWENVEDEYATEVVSC
jgi:hypothetical protein